MISDICILFDHLKLNEYELQSTPNSSTIYNTRDTRNDRRTRVKRARLAVHNAASRAGMKRITTEIFPCRRTDKCAECKASMPQNSTKHEKTQSSHSSRCFRAPNPGPDHTGEFFLAHAEKHTNGAARKDDSQDGHTGNQEERRADIFLLASYTAPIDLLLRAVTFRTHGCLATASEALRVTR